MLNVQDFGLKGDGVRIDSSVLSSLIQKLDGDGVMYFPSGNYRFGTSLALNNFAGTVKGDGIERSILEFDSCDGIVIENPGYQWPRRAVNVSDLTLAAYGTTGHTALKFSGERIILTGKQLTCLNCQIRPGVNGGTAWDCAIELNAGSASDIRGVFIEGNTRTSHGICIKRTSTDVKIIGCYFHAVHNGVTLQGDDYPADAPEVVNDPRNAGEGIVIAYNHFVVGDYGIRTMNAGGRIYRCKP